MNEIATARGSEREIEVDQLSAILERVSRLDAELVGVTIAAPCLPPETVFLSSQREPCVLWSSGAGLHEVGLGVLYRFRSRDEDSWPEVAQLANDACGEFQSLGIGACALEPRFFGGVSFFPAESPAAEWDGFANHEFVLPRMLYRVDSQRAQASLTLFASRAELADANCRQLLARRLSQTAQSVAEPRPGHERSSVRVVRESLIPSLESWNNRVDSAIRLLGTGELEKVVLARELVLQCEAPLDVAIILRRLLGRNDGSVCFAFRNGDATFLGATPERLVSRRGSRIVTEALAGSAAANDPVAIDALVRGDKDRREHAIVVREIVSRLHAMGAQVTVPKSPELRRFGPVVHLRTVLEATRLDAPHVLTLGYQLHPTPAVAGIPATSALEFIRANEPFQRGRYASPIGWFDRHGDGELVVALRSGLIREREIRLFAGAGLVDGSEPNAEWRETEIKFRSLLEALGVYREQSSSA